MNAVDFMVDWFFPIVIMVIIGIITIGIIVWLIALVIYGYSQYINNNGEGGNRYEIYTTYIN